MIQQTRNNSDKGCSARVYSDARRVLRGLAAAVALPIGFLLASAAVMSLSLLAALELGTGIGIVALNVSLLTLFTLLVLFQSRSALPPIGRGGKIASTSSAAVLALVACLGLQVAFSGVSGVDSSPPSGIVDSSELTPLELIGVLGAFGLLLPAMEELAFRRWCISKAREVVPTIAAIALSSAAFSLYHLDLSPAIMAFYFAIGIVLGWLYHHTRSIGACVAVHATNNTLAILFNG